MSGTRGLIAAGTAGAVALAAVIVMAINGFGYWSDRQEERARQDAVTAADRAVTAMFSYDFASVDTELPKAADNLSADFREDYLKLITQAIAPGAKEKQLTVKATTQASGVVSADREHAVVMLYLNQVTTSKESPQGTTTGSRVRVTLDKTDDRWLVDAVTPI
ncbi:Mce-associated membrane protein [Nocardia amikacinitolerans]|uniref:Mce-associated membrane protein n=1 Tax=Nocardia amikacinitolerans TaxID=756689 RepID=A0A285LVW9_9NOCA|nr:h domain protein [Nocardia amikacinitolerans]MCP2300249.1 Mce-associated membrane protein [Nocardia amikacinitolerans]SNY89079.1 Mce-associated membrane protein [Nocardia amikacinitolerans]